MLAALLAGAIGAVVVIPGSDASPAELHTDGIDAAARFASFIQTHGRTYSAGSEEYDTRFVHFKERIAAVDAQNRQPGSTWSAAVNHLADLSPLELAMLRGYRHSPKGPVASGPLGLAAIAARQVDMHKLPANFTWKDHLAAMRNVRDQGACGSCWAISSSTALRAHAELYQQDRTFSTQQIVDCTPNPNECGGKGGCEGATAELAMEYAVRAGLATEEEHQYQATGGTCSKQMTPSRKNLRSIVKHGVSLPQLSEHGTGGAAFGMSGWKRLAENKLEPLMEAVYTRGPVVVSVAATDVWSMYSKGVMSACEKGAVINHAVVLVGFGKDEKAHKKFWHIQNSWGPSWGEDGFVRLERQDKNKDEDGYCGYDMKPEDGTACKGGPKKVWTCGSCGILYDNVVPIFETSEHGFLSRFSRDSAGVFVEMNASSHPEF